MQSRYMEDTKQSMETILRDLQTTPVSERELQRAKAYLKGRYLLAHQSNAQYAYDLARDDLDWAKASATINCFCTTIDAVSAADIQRVARTYFTHYELVVIIPTRLVRPASKSAVYVH